MNEEITPETESVINFLKSNPHIIEDYKESVKPEEYAITSYSSLLSILRLSGTTKEGVDLRNNPKVSRSRVTKYIMGVLSNEEE
mgnify:CR=1 FL=1